MPEEEIPPFAMRKDWDYETAVKQLKGHLLSYGAKDKSRWEQENLYILNSLSTDPKRTQALEMYFVRNASPKEQMEILMQELNRKYQEQM